MAIGYGEFWRFYTYAFVHAGLGLIRTQLFIDDFALIHSLAIVLQTWKRLQ